MTVYALRHPDGRYLYHLPTPDEFRYTQHTGAFADGQAMQALSSGWWAADREATQITATALPQAKTTGYKLRTPDVESVRYPATLTPDAWEYRTEDEDNLWELYTSVKEEQPPAIEYVYDGPIQVLDGREPPRADEPQWVASLPHVLASRPEYLHLFPGHIPGLTTHLMKVFEAMPRVQHVFVNFQNRPGVYVSVRVPYDEPQTTWRADIGRKGQKLKSGRTVPVMVSRSVTLPISDRVAADTYVEALALWEQQVAYWTGVVEEATVAACSHCDGKGYVPHGSEQYSRP
ncbi:hypothetical protein [Streptomyces sp. NPDC005548]|uniref:hypothetical protein n=1 Tax=Streptomyces sp. NPDC005548 TaxID=3364724 RepID=UPI0036C9BC8F